MKTFRIVIPIARISEVTPYGDKETLALNGRSANYFAIEAKAHTAEDALLVVSQTIAELVDARRNDELANKSDLEDLRNWG